MRLFFASAVLVVIGLAPAAPRPALDAAKNRPKDFKVSVTFSNRTGDRILGNGGPYTDGEQNVVAYISSSSNGQLVFGTNTSNFPGRTLQFLFGDCLLLAPTSCELPPTNGIEKGGFQVLPLVPSNGSFAVPANGLLGMAPGTELAAFVKANIPIDSDPAFWNLCWDPREDTGGVCGASDTSTAARVRHNAPGVWTVFADAGHVSDLIKDNGTRRDRYAKVGRYEMPFEFTIQCVNLTECP